MSDLRELYQQVILDHQKKPRNFRRLDETCRHVEGYNPLCGDKVTIYLKVEGDVIKDVTFQGNGCAISTASASMMTESLKGKTLTEAEKTFSAFHDLLTGKSDDTTPLGKLAVFSGVREFPVRVKCATLPWHRFQAALHGHDTIVSTE
jgi:nitrogen fixation NifU-like protein